MESGGVVSARSQGRWDTSRPEQAWQQQRCLQLLTCASARFAWLTVQCSTPHPRCPPRWHPCRYTALLYRPTNLNDPIFSLALTAAGTTTAGTTSFIQEVALPAGPYRLEIVTDNVNGDGGKAGPTAECTVGEWLAPPVCRAWQPAPSHTQHETPNPACIAGWWPQQAPQRRP